jgi:hypothetical protein
MPFTDGVEKLAYVPRVAAVELVSLNRKKSFSWSFITWSNRTLVESSELGLDQLPMY